MGVPDTAVAEFDLAKTAQQALHEELELLAAEERDPTPGEQGRINTLAARIGREQHPNLTTPGEFAAVYANVASGLDMGDEQSRGQAALELACLEQAYPDYLG